MSGEMDGNRPAFPSGLYNGMTLRDWFAGQALCGFMNALASPEIRLELAKESRDETGCEIVARMIYEMVDAMLLARTSPTTKGEE